MLSRPARQPSVPTVAVVWSALMLAGCASPTAQAPTDAEGIAPEGEPTGTTIQQTRTIFLTREFSFEGSTGHQLTVCAVLCSPRLPTGPGSAASNESVEGQLVAAEAVVTWDAPTPLTEELTANLAVTDGPDASEYAYSVQTGPSPLHLQIEAPDGALPWFYVVVEAPWRSAGPLDGRVGIDQAFRVEGSYVFAVDETRTIGGTP